MSDKIYKFECPWDREKLMSEFNRLGMVTVSSYNSTWYKTPAEGPYAKSIAKSFPGNPYVGYYLQPEGTLVKPHKDGVATARVNVLLSGAEEVLHIGDEDVVYDCALLNVNKYTHWLDESKTARLMFSIVWHEKQHDFNYVKRLLASS